MALQTLYLFKWNNYRNKMVKGRPQISAGTPYTDSKGNSLLKFNPNDGVETECVLNLNYNTFNYDYILEVESGTNNTRAWFIKEPIRLQENQVKLKLVRDIISDYFQDTVNNELMIHRGICGVENSAIYNKEGFELNKIKSAETLLKDETGVAWIVGYIPLGVTLTGNNTFTTNDNKDVSSVTNLSDLSFYNADGKVYVENKYAIYSKFTHSSLFFGAYSVFYDRIAGEDTIENTTAGMGQPNFGTILGNYYRFEYILKMAFFANDFSWQTKIYNATKGTDSHALFAKSVLQNENKIYLETSTGKYYKLKFNLQGEKSFESEIQGTTLAQEIYDKVVDTYDGLTNEEKTLINYQKNAYDSSKTYSKVKITVSEYSYALIEQSDLESYHIVLDEFNNTNASDTVEGEPYKMFAFPFNAKEARLQLRVLNNDTPPVTSFIANDQKIINAFLSYWTKDNGRILDLQILPFCPIKRPILTVGEIKFMNCESDSILKIYNSGGYIVAAGIWINEESFRKEIEFNKIIENYKIENECNFYRLCSPHYESIFEFNAVQMKGINGFKVECTYKPYIPYIHVEPIYVTGSLYGAEKFYDARGLVSCTNYSLPLASDVWETFARTNSTYQLTFDREVQNLEVKHNAQLTKELLGIGSGAIGTTAALAKGKGIEALGAGIATAAGIGNMLTNQFMVRPEEMSFKKDMYSYNIQNIKAQPQTLTKVSGLDINNRLFPVLEYYTCTEDEKTYFERYLYFNSYRIERIGKIKDYINMQQDYTYIEAEIIRLDTNIDAHELDYLNKVLSSGVYFAGGLFNG